jgi:hypothetical protein
MRLVRIVAPASLVSGLRPVEHRLLLHLALCRLAGQIVLGGALVSGSVSRNMLWFRTPIHSPFVQMGPDDPRRFIGQCYGGYLEGASGKKCGYPSGLDGDRQAGGDRLRIACDRSVSRGWRESGFLVARGMARSRQGKKVDRRHCAIGGRGFSRPSARSIHRRGRSVRSI